MDRQAAETVTRQIRDAIDIADYISDYVTLKKRGSNHVGLCPFHQEKTPSFNVSPSKGIFKCFGCGKGGDIFTFVMLREKVEFPEARRILASRAGIELETRESRAGTRGPDKSALFRANEWAREQFRKWLNDPALGQDARDYLQRRGLSTEVIASFGLGLALARWDAIEKAADAAGFRSEVLLAAGLIRPRNSGGGHRDTFYNRLVFPISDPGGRVIGFGGRTLGDDRAKYLNTPETPIFDKGRGLYGIDLARDAIGERGRVILVEGYTDCMMAHQFGFRETLATLGTALTPDHVRLLRRYTENAYVVFDSDEAGSAAADRALDVFFTQQLDVRLVQVPEGKDPCDFLLAQGAEPFEALLNGALSALEFRWQSVARRYGNAGSGPDRRQAIDDFLSLIATSAVFGAVDPIQRGLVLNQLSKLLVIEPAELHRQLARFGRRVSSRDDPSRYREGSTERPGPRVTQVADAEQRALREILEVVVNEPGYFDRVSGCFEVSLIEDADLRAVAATVVKLAEGVGEFDVSELIARLEDEKYARLITDLQQAGEARGNFEETIELARRRLEELERERHSREAAGRLRHGAAEMSEEDQDSLLGAVMNQARQRNGPLPLNLTRRRS